MRFLLDLAYLLVLLVTSPFFIYKSIATGKYRRGLWRKLTGRTVDLRSSSKPVVWFHGVSVGEVHLLRQVVARYRQWHPGWQCVVSTTTDTGFAEAQRLFADLPVFFWPLDFSWAVGRALGRVRPHLVVIAEGERWPNFLLAARRQGIRVAIINARMSPRSHRNYRRIGLLARRLLGWVDLFAVQTEEYATAYRRLGVPARSVVVTGSVKYDGVDVDRGNGRTDAFRRLLGIEPGDLLWIAGSTQAPEEQVVLDLYRRARQVYPNVRLLIVPRQRERFEEVATLLRRSGLPFLRRSEITASGVDRKAIVLIDTIGELGALWGLAHIAFVGGSMDGKRGGQNMIEPAAYGAAVVFGPHVWNFREPAARLVEAEGAIQVADAAGLDAVIHRLLGDQALRVRLGNAARAFVLRQQGATEKTLKALDGLLPATEMAKAG
jgi:3-deoxy-D-manno-octulosonic-acid transferase